MFLKIFTFSLSPFVLPLSTYFEIRKAIKPKPIFTVAAEYIVTSSPYVLIRKNPARMTPTTAPREFRKYSQPTFFCAATLIQ